MSKEWPFSVYWCFQKKWYPQIINFNKVFHYKPSILGDFPLFLVQHPYSEQRVATRWWFVPTQSTFTCLSCLLTTWGCAAATLSDYLLLVAAARRPAHLLARLDDALRAALASWASETLGTNMEQRVMHETVDGWSPANQLRLVVYPIIYNVLYIPGGAGFQPSTVSPRFVESSAIDVFLIRLIFDDDQGFTFTQWAYPVFSWHILGYPYSLSPFEFSGILHVTTH